MNRLDYLEAESISILREVGGNFRKPVLLYSIGKDSTVLLHLALKAFAPAMPPFPLLHVDTTWKFREMITFRDVAACSSGLELIVHTNQQGVKDGVTPFTHGARYTDIMKTEALKQALDAGRYDAVIGGARRDEERSRAKERIFSLRSAAHGWDPRRQRPECWRIVNPAMAAGQHMRVFPLSDWTELDVWMYIRRENVQVVPLYFARSRPVVMRDGALIMVDDARLPLQRGEQAEMRMVRFRTLGCYPLSGAVESKAADLDSIIAELQDARQSERAGRLIDKDQEASMERKKRAGYF